MVLPHQNHHLISLWIPPPRLLKIHRPLCVNACSASLCPRHQTHLQNLYTMHLINSVRTYSSRLRFDSLRSSALTNRCPCQRGFRFFLFDIFSLVSFQNLPWLRWLFPLVFTALLCSPTTRVGRHISLCQDCGEVDIARILIVAVTIIILLAFPSFLSLLGTGRGSPTSSLSFSSRIFSCLKLVCLLVLFWRHV